MNNNRFWALILIVMFFYMSQTPTTPPTTDDTTNDDSEIANLVDADVSFTGLNKYVTGTATTTEHVRIFKANGDSKDLGAVSLNSGTLAVTPNTDYIFYFFMNASVPSKYYYVDKQEYTAKPQESVDNVVGHGCRFYNSSDTPLVTIRDSSSRVQSSSSNAQAIGASSTVDVSLTIRVDKDYCYGNPGADKGNALCFAYSTTAFSSVETNGKKIYSIPFSVFNTSTSFSKYTPAYSCYEFPLLEDGEEYQVKVTLTSTTTNPSAAHNISVFTDDVALDLDQTTLEEIWDYEDEDNTQLGRIISSTTPDAYIYVS